MPTPDAPRPRRTLLRILAIVLIAGLGAVLGFVLARGVLLAGIAVQASAAAAGGVLAGAAQALGRRRVLWAAVGVLAVTIATSILLQLHRFGALGPLSQDRTASFERLWRAVDMSYPYFDIKSIDWDQARARTLPLIEAAGSDAEYYAAIEGMLLALGDTHTWLDWPGSGTRCCFAITREIEGRAVVVEAGVYAQEMGLVRGSVIERVDGLAVEDALGRVDPGRTTASTPWTARNLAFFYLLSLPPGQEALDITFSTSGGETAQVTLTWADHSAANAALAETPRPRGPVVTGERLPSGYGLIRVPRLSAPADADLVAEFDAALDSLSDAPGLILDLRGNGGGSSMLGDQMVGRLLAEPFVYGHELYRRPLPMRFWMRSAPYRVAPRASRYAGPVVVLIDELVASSAENMLAALVDSGRAQTVGRTTSGASGNPLNFRLPGGASAHFSTGDFRRLDGTRIEGRGITPDVPVTWTLEDFYAGRDPDLLAAEALLDARSGQ